MLTLPLLVRPDKKYMAEEASKPKETYPPNRYYIASHGDNMANLHLSLANSTIGLKQSAGHVGQTVLLTYNDAGKTYVAAVGRLLKKKENVMYGDCSFPYGWEIVILRVHVLNPILLNEIVTGTVLGYAKRSMRTPIKSHTAVTRLNALFFASEE
jgi:hypothetical protein